MLAAYAKHEKTGRQTLEFFQKMLLEGVAANVVSFTCVVGACSRPELSEQGTVIHEQITCSGLVADSFLAAALVNMYSKCGRLGSAWELFQRVDVKMSLVSWNSILAAHAQRADLTKVLEIFGMLQLEGLKPSGVTLISVLGGCCSTQALRIVEHIYERVAQEGEISHDLFLGTALMTSLCDCGKLADAESLFYRLNRWNAASWNTMIAGYVQHGFDLQALHLLYEMDLEGIKPNVVTFLGIVDACSSLAVLGNAKAVHERISASKVGLDTVLGTAIVSMYANCDSLEDSRRVFESLDLRDTVSWNAVIACHSDLEAASWFVKMDLEGVKPDKNTFTAMFAASTTLQQGEMFLQRFMNVGYELDDVAVLSLIELYGRFGNVTAATDVFNALKNKNVVSWTAMVTACMNNETGVEEAWLLFQRMQLEGIKPNSVTFISLLGCNCSFIQGKRLHELISTSAELTVDPLIAAALMNTYARTGNLHRTRDVFEELQWSELCWNSLLRAYAEQGHAYQVLESFRCMIHQGLKPDNDTFIFVLHACSHAGSVEQACDLFNSITRDHNLLPAIQHYVCVIDLLGRAGWLENAHELINRMPYQPNSLAWSTLLGACGMYGDTDRGTHAAGQVTTIEQGKSRGRAS
ncbi:pentatricopeptide repeat-containing protein At5g27110 isoform X2 [Selaginella moellendorffii]|uniref:pentatricopeptide repeat-containing protein At5g27110 isoform X2 n=1 Tax=Selaginella moellendorffii TaxID=88036 RepID=UPI000D1C5107|nr:pentatricopeptide repeat-containing protein At5g27110 isoform X2 [Selaginella moellendorffii]|eukprot:XP_024531960.1 pentatricopeptide repeat-containing protein At5g27110 isoform X2 [Selaginella moellendorffii]